MVDCPMDFGTMLAKLEGGRYKWAGQYFADAGLVFANCLLYNEEGSDIHKSCVDLRNAFFDMLWYGPLQPICCDSACSLASDLPHAI
jgi:hypothetical protein